MDIELELQKIFTAPFLRAVEITYKKYSIDPSSKNHEALTKAIKMARNKISKQTESDFFISNTGKSREPFNLYTQIID